MEVRKIVSEEYFKNFSCGGAKKYVYVDETWFNKKGTKYFH